MQFPKKPIKVLNESNEVFLGRIAEWKQDIREYNREYAKQKRLQETPEERQSRLEKAKRRRAQETPEQREKRATKAKATKQRLGAAHLKESRANYRKNNREREKANNKQWLANNPEAKSKHDKTYRDRHSDKIKARQRTPEFRAKMNARKRKQYHSNINIRIEKCLRAAFTQALRLQRTTKTERVFYPLRLLPTRTHNTY